MAESSKSSRPIWLGRDERRFDHVRVHYQVLQDERLGAYDIAVYVGLVMHAETSTGKCWPSADTLASYINGGAKSVRRSIRVLQDTGYIRLERQAGKANVYYVLAPPVIHTSVTETTLEIAGMDSQTKHPRLNDRPTLDSPTDELEPLTRTKNKRFQFGSVPERREGCPQCNYETVVWTRDNEAEPCKCVTAS